MITHVLAPVDFSRRCAAAAPFAVALADRFQAKLTFAYVIPGLPYQGTDEETFYGPRGELISGRELDRYYRTRLDQFVEQATSGADADRILLKGDVTQRLEEYAREAGVDLVVIPTHGYGPFRHMLIGSVASRILHDLACPIFTGAHVPELPGIPRGFKRVTCALDLGPQSETVLRWACSFSRAWEARLTVVHAAPQVGFEVDRQHFVAGDWHDALVGAGQEKIERLLEQANCHAQVRVESGHPVHSVVTVAAEERADVLIIGRGRSSQALAGSRLPTHAYGIIRSSNCPVISI